MCNRRSHHNSGLAGIKSKHLLFTLTLSQHWAKVQDPKWCKTQVKIPVVVDHWLSLDNMEMAIIQLAWSFQILLLQCFQSMLGVQESLKGLEAECLNSLGASHSPSLVLSDCISLDFLNPDLFPVLRKCFIFPFAALEGTLVLPFASRSHGRTSSVSVDFNKGQEEP